MIEQVDRRLWTYGESLFPGAAHQWAQDTSWGRLRWFLAFPYAYPASPSHRPVVEIETVFIRRHPDPEGDWPPDNETWRIHVIIRNIGPETVRSYSIWVAQTMATAVASVTTEQRRAGTRVLVAHEADGKILSVGVPLDETDGRIELIPETGQVVSEVEVPDLRELSDLGTNPQLDFQIVTSFKLELDDPGPRLVRKY